MSVGQVIFTSSDLPAGFPYGICPKISYTRDHNKMADANSADLDQTAPE